MFFTLNLGSINLNNKRKVFAFSFFNKYIYNQNLSFPLIYYFPIFKEKNFIYSYNDNLIFDMLIFSLSYFKKIFKIRKKITIFIKNFSAFNYVFIIKNIINTGEKKKFKFITRENSIYEITYDYFSFKDYGKIFLDLFKENKYLDIIDSLLSKFSLKMNLQYFFWIKKKLFNSFFSLSILMYNNLFDFFLFIYQNFSIKIYNYSSISTLSFAIYKKKYYTDFIKISNSSLYSDYIYNLLKDSYRGGKVEIYKPLVFNGLFLDINSAYSYSMLNLMPIGHPKVEKINILDSYKDANTFLLSGNFFGFIEADIYVPYNNYIPILGFKSLEKGAIIYPTGVFRSSFFSEELKYAINVNKIKVIKIYKIISYKKGYIFRKFVDFFYNFSEDKKNIAKLMLNSLYGRMGLSKKIDKVLKIKKSDLYLYQYIFDLTIISSLNNSNDYILVLVSSKFSDNIIDLIDKSFFSIIDKKKIKDIYNKKIIHQFNLFNALHVASSITSYSRIHIDFIKRSILHNNINLYYSDTDSVVCDSFSNFNGFLGYCIGDLKISYIIKYGFFLAPKSYFLSLTGGKVEIKFKGAPQKNIFKLKFNYFFFLFLTGYYSEHVYSIRFKWNSKLFKNFLIMEVFSSSVDYYISIYYTKRKKIYNKFGVWIDSKPISF